MDFEDSNKKEEFRKIQLEFNTEFEKLLSKVSVLMSKFNEYKEENYQLKETIKNLNNKITELKLQFNKINTELIQKEQEITSLKNSILSSDATKISIFDKDNLKSRIKELISRIDVHLDQYEKEEREDNDF
jgi:peptidoglycan hydrolase CwlO-like protein